MTAKRPRPQVGELCSLTRRIAAATTIVALLVSSVGSVVGHHCDWQIEIDPPTVVGGADTFSADLLTAPDHDPEPGLECRVCAHGSRHSTKPERCDVATEPVLVTHAFDGHESDAPRRPERGLRAERAPPRITPESTSAFV